MIKEFQREYRWLSNFSPCAVMFEGERYDSQFHNAQTKLDDWEVISYTLTEIKE